MLGPRRGEQRGSRILYHDSCIPYPLPQLLLLFLYAYFGDSWFLLRTGYNQSGLEMSVAVFLRFYILLLSLYICSVIISSCTVCTCPNQRSMPFLPALFFHLICNPENNEILMIQGRSKVARSSLTCCCWSRLLILNYNLDVL